MKRMAGIPDRRGYGGFGINLQIGEQKRFATRLMTAPIGLDSYEYRVNLRQR
jgi:hypothetical protein